MGASRYVSYLYDVLSHANKKAMIDDSLCTRYRCIYPKCLKPPLFLKSTSFILKHREEFHGINGNKPREDMNNIPDNIEEKEKGQKKQKRNEEERNNPTYIYMYMHFQYIATSAFLFLTITYYYR